MRDKPKSGMKRKQVKKHPDIRDDKKLVKGMVKEKCLKQGDTMPFKSKAQAKYLFANEPEVAKEFASKTKSIKKLPEHVKPKKKK